MIVIVAKAFPTTSCSSHSCFACHPPASAGVSAVLVSPTMPFPSEIGSASVECVYIGNGIYFIGSEAMNQRNWLKRSTSRD